MSEKWIWSRNEDEELWVNGREDSKEDAVETGRNEIKSDNRINKELGNPERIEKFYIGRCKKYIPPSPNADEIIENLYEIMCYDFPDDVALEYLTKINIDEEKLLQEKLDNTWSEWLEETNNDTNLFNIVDIEEIKVYPEKKEGE